VFGRSEALSKRIVGDHQNHNQLKTPFSIFNRLSHAAKSAGHSMSQLGIDTSGCEFIYGELYEFDLVLVAANHHLNISNSKETNPVFGNQF